MSISGTTESERLLGRSRELARLEQILDDLGDGGAALVVHGEAGIGKTTLLEAVARGAAARGITVIRTTGVPSESGMPYAGLHRLLQPHLAKVPALPGPQREALSAAFGLSQGAAPDVFLIALAVLELLAETAATAPLLLVIEDAHWLDADTSEVLSFVARRVEIEPIALFFAVRDGHASRFEEAGLPTLQLGGLDEVTSTELLELHAPKLSPEVRDRILDASAGNPLALVELPRAVSQGIAASVVLAPVPMTERLERAFSERLAIVPRATSDLLLIAALDEGGGLTEQIVAASKIVGRVVTPGDLAPAEEAGLVVVDGAAVRFRHPLVRAAVYAAVPVVTRRSAHGALAVAYADDIERSVWHRAEAQSGPNEQVATDLEDAASRALQRGAPAVAAAALERAAELTAGPARRGGLLVRAAEMEFELGRATKARELLDDAAPLELEPDVRSRLTFLSEASDEVSWAGAARVAAFAEIANQRTLAADPEHALKALEAAALRCWWGNPGQETRDLVVRAAAGLDVPEDDPGLLAVLAFADPVRNGAVVIERISRLTPDAEDPTATHLIGTAATAVLSFDTSMDFLASAIDGLRGQGRLAPLARALVSQAWAAVHLGRPSLAASAAEEAERLAKETDQLRWSLAAQLVLATVAGERGDSEEAEALAQEAEQVLLPMGTQPMLALVQFARGRRAVAHQHYEDGYEHLRRTRDPRDVGYHPFVAAWGLADLIDAAAHTDRLAEAERLLQELETLAQAMNSSYLRATLAYARPLLAGDDAGRLYEAALSSELVNWPCFRGRLLLSNGRWLRRQRRVTESRVPLRAARDVFDALGFDGLSETARQELRASGESSGRRLPDAREGLTPQELQIAGMAAAGLTNREIGQKLYLSHRTVESHLYRIFPKLGITSRAQLAGVLADGATSDGARTTA
jgi:DNA-binding CsgD family transcriptional regulator